MKAAIVRGPGQTPAYGEFAEPTVEAGEQRVTVTAAALSPLVRGRAAGTHYSARGRYPFVAGVDGVGRLDDGRRVYFVLPRAPHGAMAERTVVVAAQCVPLPDGLDEVTAAALANPGMSSWAGLTVRAGLKAGETVLVNGATGTAGRLAVQIAKHLGAKKIIATGRNETALKEVAALGATVTLPLTGDESVWEERCKAEFAAGVDVVIDYLWGPSARTLLVAAAKAAEDGVPLRFVQVGSVSGAEIALPSAVLRAKTISLMGSGIGSVPLSGLVNAIGEMLQAARAAGLKVATETVPLERVEEAWTKDDGTGRIVFTTGR